MRKLLLAVLLLLPATTFARDNGQYAQVDPKIRDWFNQLASKNGLCCSFSDGVAIQDPDWRLTASGTYQVFYKEEWRDVPPEAVISGGNRIGHAVLWPVINGDGSVWIRCFLRGQES
jgi:hypothetical protein